jgi:hypothetical protein
MPLLRPEVGQQVRGCCPYRHQASSQALAQSFGHSIKQGGVMLKIKHGRKSAPRSGISIRAAKPSIRAVNINKWALKKVLAHYDLIGVCIPFWARMARHQTKTVPRTWFHFNVQGAHDD